MIYLKIASMSIELNLPFRIEWTKQITPFIAGSIDKPKNRIKVDFCPLIPHLRSFDLEHCISSDGQKRVSTRESAMIFYEKHLSSDLESVTEIKKNQVQIYCSDEWKNNFKLSHILLRRMCFETLFLYHQIFMIHSSLIEYKQKTVLFSAPSQTGKSTQAELWRKFKGARILNGDRSALTNESEFIMAYGIPFAGTSEIYVNEGYPVQGIIILRQAKENTIHLLSPREAFVYLYPEVSIPRTEEVLMEIAADLLLDVLKKVPVYLLNCRPDEEAVNLVCKTLFDHASEKGV